MTIKTIQTKLTAERAAYLTCTGGMFEHYSIANRITKLRQQLATWTTPHTVIDWDGEFEGTAIAAGAEFSVTILPIPTTDPRNLAPFVAAVHIGEVCHA